MCGNNAPIAVFDSGVGGISVLRELVRELPHENFYYFGDSKNAPYGPRPAEEVCALTMDCAKTLFARDCKALVVACNTATSAAIETLRETYPGRPIVGIEPALKPAVAAKEHPGVLVMATAMTLREEKFRRLMESYADRAQIYRLPAPGIVEFVERGVTEGPELERYLRGIFEIYQNRQIDSIVLGCTHFPFVRGEIVRCFGRPVEIFDGAPGTARETRRRLEEEKLLNPSPMPGVVSLHNSADTPHMLELSRRLLAI